jgi:hypothetical protein
MDNCRIHHMDTLQEVLNAQGLFFRSQRLSAVQLTFIRYHALVSTAIFTGSQPNRGVFQRLYVSFLSFDPVASLVYLQGRLTCVPMFIQSGQPLTLSSFCWNRRAVSLQRRLERGSHMLDTLFRTSSTCPENADYNSTLISITEHTTERTKYK